MKQLYQIHYENKSNYSHIEKYILNDYNIDLSYHTSEFSNYLASVHQVLECVKSIATTFRQRQLLFTTHKELSQFGNISCLSKYCDPSTNNNLILTAIINMTISLSCYGQGSGRDCDKSQQSLTYSNNDNDKQNANTNSTYRSPHIGSTSNSGNQNSNISGNSDGEDNNNDDDNNNNNNGKSQLHVNTDYQSDNESDDESDSESDDNEVDSETMPSAKIIQSAEEEDETQGSIEVLADLFPIYPRSELAVRLKSAKGIEELIETLILEQENQLSDDDGTKVHSNAVNALKEIFPKCSYEFLQKALDNNDGNVELATSYILQDNSEDNSKVQKRHSSFKHVKDDNKREPSSWVTLQTDSKKLEAILNIPSLKIISYLHKYEGKFHETLIAIIYDNGISKSNASSECSLSSRSSLASLSKALPKGGRVQGPSQKPLVEIATINWGDVSLEEAYFYDENSLEAKELRAIYIGNTEFKTISEMFFQKALIFFKGNVAKVIEVAALLVQDRAGHLTFQNKPSLSAVGRLGSKKRVQILSPSGTHIRNPTSRSISPYFSLSLSGSDSNTSIVPSVRRSASPTEMSIKNDRLRTAAKENTLDLHNLTVPVALEATAEALRDWWEDELDQRLQNGNLARFGARAEFVHPLNLITGRGIHSTGGRAKIRVAIKKYLTNNSYVYEEHSGRFEIEGKR